MILQAKFLLLLLVVASPSVLRACDNDGTVRRIFGTNLKKEDTLDHTLDAGLFEGDIEDVSVEEIMSGERNAIIATHKRWPRARIPFVIAPDYSKAGRKIIVSAMEEFHRRTCIHFVPRTNQKDYIVLRSRKGCSSPVGKVGGEQQVSVAKDGCVHHGIIVHELMHAIGFWHEQSRGDRDHFVSIDWDNIEPENWHNFHKYDWNTVQHLNEAYDMSSIMHYSAVAFAKSKSRPTIVPKDANFRKTIGQRQKLSDGDVRKINKLYGCKNRKWN